MSTEKITINAEKRDLVAKGALAALRKTGLVPAVIYGKNGTTNISIPMKGLPKGHTRAKLLEINVGGSKKTVLMREVQINPLSDAPIHIDFHEVDLADVINAKVPLEFVGLTREQEKEGSFKSLLRSLDVRAPAGKVPAVLQVQVGNLKVDETAHITDVIVPEGVQLRAKKNLALASLVRL